MATLPRMKPVRFYDLVVEVAIHPARARLSARWSILISIAATIAPRSSIRIRRSNHSAPHARRPAFSGAVVAHGDDGGGLQRRRVPKSSAARWDSNAPAERMEKIEERCAPGCLRNGIQGGTADDIVRSITYFALYGFPESHARQLRANRVCVRVYEVSSSGGVSSPRC